MTIQDRIGKFKLANREWYIRNVNTIKVFSIHHDAIPQDNRTADQVMQQIMNGHVGQGWPGASYHYYIHRDGAVYQMNKHEWVTWIDGVNWDAIGVVLNGNFQFDKPTQAQLKSLKELLDELANNHPEFPADQSGVFGHRERKATSCPGDNLFPYVKEYREKLGQVNWDITPQPPQPILNDQTVISATLLGWEQSLEIQQVRGLLGDLKKVQEENRFLKISNLTLTQANLKLQDILLKIKILLPQG